MSKMVAKFRVSKVTKQDGMVSLEMAPVSAAPFDKDGVSEDNSFAKWTPSGALAMTITNPTLLDTFKEGEKYYLNFSPAS